MRTMTGGQVAGPDGQVGADVSQGEDPLETGHEDIIDAVAPCSFVPLEERADAVRADAALYRLDAGQGAADLRRRYRVRRVVGEVVLHVLVGGGAAQLGDPAQDRPAPGHPGSGTPSSMR